MGSPRYNRAFFERHKTIPIPATHEFHCILDPLPECSTVYVYVTAQTGPSLQIRRFSARSSHYKWTFYPGRYRPSRFQFLCDEVDMTPILLLCPSDRRANKFTELRDIQFSCYGLNYRKVPTFYALNEALVQTGDAATLCAINDYFQDDTMSHEWEVIPLDIRNTFVRMFCSGLHKKKVTGT